VRLNIRRSDNGGFECGHYVLDRAASSASRLTWRDCRKVGSSKASKRGSTSTWRRLAPASGTIPHPTEPPPGPPDDLSRRIAQLLQQVETNDTPPGDVSAEPPGGSGCNGAPAGGAPPRVDAYPGGQGFVHPYGPSWSPGFVRPPGAFQDPYTQGPPWSSATGTVAGYAVNQGSGQVHTGGATGVSNSGYGHRHCRRRRSRSTRRHREHRSSSGGGGEHHRRRHRRRRRRRGEAGGAEAGGAAGGGVAAAAPAHSALAARFAALAKGLEELASSGESGPEQRSEASYSSCQSSSSVW